MITQFVDMVYEVVACVKCKESNKEVRHYCANLWAEIQHQKIYKPAAQNFVMEVSTMCLRNSVVLSDMTACTLEDGSVTLSWPVTGGVFRVVFFNDPAKDKYVHVVAGAITTRSGTFLEYGTEHILRTLLRLHA